MASSSNDAPADRPPDELSREYREQGFLWLPTGRVEDDVAELRGLLQSALQLEHATIPVYLTGLYSLRPTMPWRVAEILRTVVVEEMLHLTLVANLLNAVGGDPVLDDPDFLPAYPAYLPYRVDGIKLDLLPFSPEFLTQALLIEHPKGVIPKKVEAAARDPNSRQAMTIGEFYVLIESKLESAVRKHGERAVFSGPCGRQVHPNRFYYDAGGQPTVVTDLASAKRAIAIITDQGEGVERSVWADKPPVPAGDRLPSHYARFLELRDQRLFAADDTLATGPRGAPIEVPPFRAYNVGTNCKLKDYPVGGEVRERAEALNREYWRLLRDLEAAFRGHPGKLEVATQAMTRLRDLATRLIRNPFPGMEARGLYAGPTFEYAAPDAPGAARVTNPREDRTMTDAASRPPQAGKPLPDVPAPWTMPFYYANLVNCAVYYLVDPPRAEPFLKGTGLAPAVVDGKALAGFNFQLYSGQFSAGRDLPPEKWSGQGMGITQELELTILAYPAARADQVARVSARQFLLGEEQSKLCGHHRVHVPCDADVAIGAGKTLFGEPKFKTTFLVNLPSLNPVRGGGAALKDEWLGTWGFRVNDPGPGTNAAIFTCVIDLAGLVAVPAAVGAVTEYGSFNGELIGCRWEFLGPMATYFPDPGAGRVRLTYGESNHRMKQDMQHLIGDTPPYAVQTFLSAAAAIQHRAYYP